MVRLYHHRVVCSKYPRQSVEYAVLVAEKPAQHLLVLCFIEILPKSRHPPLPHPENGFF